MDIFDEIVKCVADVCPKFNDYALRGVVKENINNSPEFVAVVFREGFKLVNDDIELVKYDIMSPEDRVVFELKPAPNKSQPAKIPLTMSHLRLVEYTIRHQDKFITTKLYTPYVHHDMLCTNGKYTMVRKVILEKTFSREQTKDTDGISVSPIRVNLKFNRRRTFRIESYVSGETFTHFIVTAGLFHRPPKVKICDLTILHYILAKFGFEKTLKKFGISKSDVTFTTEIGADTDKFDYFAGRQYRDTPEDGPGLFLRVRKTLMADDQSRKFIVNLVYILSFFPNPDIENVYVEKGSVWKVILGILSLEKKQPLQAYNNAETHLRSVDYFIDPVTRDRFRSFGVQINDMYDLLVYIFTNIDETMALYQSQDIYNCRLDVSNGLLVETFARKIFPNIYALAKKTNIKISDVSRAMSIPVTTFRTSAMGKKDESEQYLAPPDIVGDNYLFSGGLTKIRLNGRPEQRLHPSIMVGESIGAFVGKPIGKTGYLNPFIPTTENGAIEHPDYASAIDAITPYLPR